MDDILLVFGGEEFRVLHTNVPDLSPEVREAFIRETADSIADLKLFQREPLSTYLESEGVSTEEAIAQRRRGLELLGADADQEIAAAVVRFEALSVEEQALRCIEYV